jgi:hypothetical protein
VTAHPLHRCPHTCTCLQRPQGISRTLLLLLLQLGQRLKRPTLLSKGHQLPQNMLRQGLQVLVVNITGC